MLTIPTDLPTVFFLHFFDSQNNRPGLKIETAMEPIYQELPFPDASFIDFYKEELPHFIVPWHNHQKIEIMHILSGTGTRFVGDHIERYQAGDTCLIGPLLPHEWRSDEVSLPTDAQIPAACYCIYFQKEIFEKNLIHLPEMTDIRLLLERSQRGIRFVSESQKQIGHFIRQMIHTKGVAKITHLISLLELMATTDEYELLASNGYAKMDNTGDFDRFNKIYQYVMANFNRPISLNEIASLCGLSPNAFCRYFMKRTKMTFVQYLNAVRIGHAKKLLIEGKLKISTVSVEAGFNNISHFIELFKRSTLLSPSEYQKQFKVDNRKLL